MADLFASVSIDEVNIAKRRPRGDPTPAGRIPLGLRWVVERTNSWLARFGQLRRNTDRRPAHSLAELALATAVLITGKPIHWRNRWSPHIGPYPLSFLTEMGELLTPRRMPVRGSDLSARQQPVGIACSARLVGGDRVAYPPARTSMPTDTANQ